MFDEKQFLALMPNLRAFAISLCGSSDLAEDLVQDTYIKAWDYRDSFEEGSNLRAWLFTILRNTYFSHYRKKRREFEDIDGVRAAQLAILPDQIPKLELDDLRAAMDKLPVDQREALVLVGAAGFSYEEAAEICRCAVGTIKSRVHRARDFIEKMLNGKGQRLVPAVEKKPLPIVKAKARPPAVEVVKARPAAPLEDAGEQAYNLLIASLATDDGLDDPFSLSDLDE